jgi:hypothetical protein
VFCDSSVFTEVMTFPFRWNFSSRARALSGGDAIVLSIPKSGRTWMRAFLCAYYCRRYGREMTLEPEQYGEPGIPRVIYTHDWFEHRTKSDRWDLVRGKYLVPAAELRRAKIVLLARDPRDAFVSLYVQMTRRTRETPEQLKEKSVSELLRDPAHGISSMVEVMNRWLTEFSGRENFMLATYESLRRDPERHFRELLDWLGEQPVQPEAYAHALAFSDFGNMKKLEQAGAFESKILQAGDVRDPESFKVRRGKVGGFQEYLQEEDRAFAARAMSRLDPRFGYNA